MRKLKVMSLILALCATTSMSIPVHAANTGDTALPPKKIGFTVSSGAYTGLRAKQNTTSHYIKNTSRINLWIISMNSNYENLTVNYKAIVPPAERFIRNYVFERGNRECKLNITTTVNGTTGLLSGWWSPDSVGSYPNAN